MSVQWFIYRDKKSNGPYTTEEVKRFAAEGIIDAGTQLRKSTSDRWFKAEEFTSLENYFRPPDEVEEVEATPSSLPEAGSGLPSASESASASGDLDLRKETLALPKDAVVEELIKDSGEIPESQTVSKKILTPDGFGGKAPSDLPESSTEQAPLQAREAVGDAADTTFKKATGEAFGDDPHAGGQKAVRLVNKAPVDGVPTVPSIPQAAPGAARYSRPRNDIEFASHFFLGAIGLVALSVLACMAHDVLAIVNYGLGNSIQQVGEETMRETGTFTTKDGEEIDFRNSTADYDMVVAGFVQILYVMVHLFRALASIAFVVAFLFWFNSVPHGPLKNLLAAGTMVSIAALLIQLGLKLYVTATPALDRIPFDFNVVSYFMFPALQPIGSHGNLTRLIGVGLAVDAICIAQLIIAVSILKQIAGLVKHRESSSQYQAATWSFIGHGGLVIFIYIWPLIMFSVYKGISQDSSLDRPEQVQAIFVQSETFQQITMFIDSTLALTCAIGVFMIGKIAFELRRSARRAALHS